MSTAVITDWPEALPGVWKRYHENGYTVIIRVPSVYLRSAIDA